MARTGWLTLGEASRALGVDPGTLRRWADGGKIAHFQTPGGHRRFLRETIEALVPELQRRVRADVGAQDWRSRLDEGSLRWFRESGMRMTELLVRTLEGAPLREALVLGREYGIEATRAGLSLGEATQAFLFFRSHFLAEIAALARRRSLPSDRAATLLARADGVLDRVILALIAGHQAPRPR